jgi:hypothetical protein
VGGGEEAHPALTVDPSPHVVVVVMLTLGHLLLRLLVQHGDDLALCA